MARQKLGASKDAGRADTGPPSSTANRRQLIVGIGASAGGLEAFSSFFGHMPANNGMCFILVQHLAPDHRSLLVELLGRTTQMQVKEATDGVKVAPDTVYVIPPDATLTIERGMIRIVSPAPPRELRRPIDTFFHSLAEDQGENAVCIVLSGTGTDGSVGLKAIKEHGGLTMAQADVNELALSGMPASATSTGLVDYVVEVQKMPERLLQYRDHLTKLDDHKGPDGTPKDAGDILEKICALLKNRVGHDFSQYRPNTLLRRIQRRMQVLQIVTISSYLDRLREDPHQIEVLFRDMLVSVTDFFRDPDTFEILRNSILAPLVREKAIKNEPIRIWTAGCATGQEAYSIAILVKELLEEQEAANPVQIFATDIDDNSIEIARAGRYRSVKNLSPTRLSRWFVKDESDWVVSKSIREICVFSPHSLVKDPPFSRLDLISCRNVMIYLEPELQHQIVRSFHYALKPGGFLMLGSAESLIRHREFFADKEKKHHIFRRRDDVIASLPLYSSMTTVREPSTAAPARSLPRDDVIERGAREFMERHSPAYVVVDRDNMVRRFFGRTGRYLEPSSGVASLDLLSILAKDLRAPCQAATDQAFATKRQVIHRSIPVDLDGGSRLITVVVEPIQEADDNLNLVVVGFQEQELPEALSEDRPTAGNRNSDDEYQVDGLRIQLQAARDDAEGAHDELRSTLEEYQAVNEELQSLNEELETSKEEQQSVNEELQTINAELASANAALTSVNGDLRNLLDSTEIATLFLTADLRIKNFTPAMRDIFHLQDSDRGRPITDIANRLTYSDLVEDSKRVLGTLAVMEMEVSAPYSGKSFLMRMRPYRGVDNVVDGIVITFVDMTLKHRGEQARARLAAIVDTSHDAIIGLTPEGVVTSWNNAAVAAFGFTAQDVIGRTFSELLEEAAVIEFSQVIEQSNQGQPTENFDVGCRRQDGSRIVMSMTVSPIYLEHRVVAASVIARDISRRQAAQDDRELLIAELDHRVKNMLALVSALATQTLRNTAAPGEFAKAFLGRLKAMSLVQRLLTHTNWEGVRLSDIVREELAIYKSPNETFVIEGPDSIVLTAKATMTLAMAIHELATNAIKYGALSVSDGVVRVVWTLDQTPEVARVRLDWTETGGPAAAASARRGFGTTLIEQIPPYELGGTVVRTFSSTGLRCTFDFPLDSKVGYVDPPLSPMN